MHSATSSIRVCVAPPRSLVICVLAGIALAAIVWTRPPSTQLNVANIQSLLPPGSVIRSLARLEMDGHAPAEAAVVAAVPSYPGPPATRDYAFILGFDRWTRRFARLYAQPLPGPLHLSVDAGFLIAGREAVVFSALQDDGRQAYQVVGSIRGVVRMLHRGLVSGRVLIDEPLLIENGVPPRALVWNGRRFGEQPLPTTIPTSSRGITWRYAVRNGEVIAPSFAVRLRVRQPLRLVGGRGRGTPIIVPDPRLDVVENGDYRARRPGVYRIRLLLPFALDENGYTLLVNVE